jgi:uncharacterized protein with NAD-binding domain and iron-sulfur cluster
VAVLGGGPAAITAAFELTAPELGNRFEVTIYQLGWRLGGKCASGRNTEQYGRIEEHGLHVWFGFYDNAFSVMRAAYEQLGRPPGHPLATLEDAFHPCDELVLFDRQGVGWQDFRFTWPRNGQTPGEPAGLPDFWEIAARTCEWAVDQWAALSTESSEKPRAGVSHRPLTPAWLLDSIRALGAGVGIDSERGGENLLHLARDMTRSAQALSAVRIPCASLPSALKLGPLKQISAEHLLAILLTRFRDWMWEYVVQDSCESDAHLRLFFTTFDAFASATAGIVEDGVLEHGWETINDRELCDWLSAHGAKQVTIGATPEQRSPLLRAIYDVAFGYPGGVIEDADVAAGTAMNDLLRLAFSYRGALLYKMQAGMGDTVFTPLYEILKRRGVRFEFFHAVTDLGLSDDGQLIEEIEVVPQVKLNGSTYAPLIPVEGLECWPSEPRWEQLHEGEQLKGRGVNFELEANPLKRNPITLRRGTDFDAVVLGIPVGALPQICSSIAERHKPFARMLKSAKTVRTQAFQLWLTKPTPKLGWTHGTNSVVGCYVEPLDTWCDMSHLLVREAWPPGEGVHGVAYFCGVLDDRPGEDHAAATARVKENAQAFVKAHLAGLWPKALAKGVGEEIDWALLVDHQRGEGPARLAAQYWRANTTPSERYVLTPAKSVADRLAADESGVANLVLAGDWTRNGIDGGCVEAAMTSGMQAARALIGHDQNFTGESPTWLTDRAAPARRAPARPTRGRPASAPPTSVAGRPASGAYVEYAGRVTAPPPFISREGRFNGFVLEGDRAQMEALCQRTFNVPAAGAVEYMPLSNHLVALTGTFGAVSSSAPGFEHRGSVEETQISIWMPLAAGHREGGQFVADRLCMAVPYIFVDNPMSYVGGREDYGYPKSMGRFLPTSGLGEQLRVETFGGNFASTSQGDWHLLLELARVSGDASAAAAAAASASATASTAASPRVIERSWYEPHEIARRLAHAADEVESLVLPDLAFVENLVSDLLHKRARQVFLKQFRDASPSGQACYQAVVEAPIQITAVSWRPALEQWKLTVHPLDSHPIADDLGLTTQTTRLTFELKMEMIVEPGVIVARST